MRVDVSVAVALATYNGEQYLNAQLHSLSMQTRLPDELIISDDHSTDGTLSLLYSYQRIAPFSVRILEGSKNIGYVKNFERAVRSCKAQVIFLCDQDDEWMPNKIEIMTKCLVATNCGFVFSDAALTAEDGKDLGSNLWNVIGFTKDRQKTFEDGGGLTILLGGNVVQGASLAFWSRHRSRILPFPEHWHHDEWIAFQLEINEIHGVPLSAPLIQYRQHEGQVLSATRRKESPLVIGPIHLQRANRVTDLAMSSYVIREQQKAAMLLNLSTARVPQRLQRSFIRRVCHLHRRFSMGKAPFIHRLIIAMRELLNLNYLRYKEGVGTFIGDVLDP